MTSIGAAVARQAQRTFTRLHAAVYKASGGRVLGRFGQMEAVVLTTTGRTSGTPRETMLTGFGRGEGFVVIASNGGARSHPQWYRNLAKNPAVQLRRGAVEHLMTARTTTGAERAELLAEAVRLNAGYGKSEGRTDRVFPVVVLDPAGPAQVGPRP
jgi:deazaflavin-dependent oxidoreductase (nitroreductase family)